MSAVIPAAIRRPIIENPQKRSGYDALVLDMQHTDREASLRGAIQSCALEPEARRVRANLHALLMACNRWDRIDASIPRRSKSIGARANLPVDLDESVSLYDRLLEQMRLRSWEGWTPSRVEDSKNRFPLDHRHLSAFRRSEVSSGTQTIPDVPLTFPRLDFSRLYPDYTDEERVRETPVLRSQYYGFFTRLFRRGAPGIDWFESLVPDDDRFGARTLDLPGVGTTTGKSIQASYYACQIYSLVPANGVVLEIGGGFGAVASKLLAIRPDITYVLTDLPVNMVLTYTYLRSFFGDAVAGLWEDATRPSSGQRAIVVPPWRLASLGIKVDLAVNTMSFQHMDERNHAFYGNALKRLGTRRIYHVNRNVFIGDPATDTMVVPAENYSFMQDYEIVSQHPFDNRWIEVFANARN